MNIKDWISENNKFPEEFAASVGCSLSTVYKWMSGSNKPSRAYIRIIKIYTNNQITEKDFKKEKKNV